MKKLADPVRKVNTHLPRRGAYAPGDRRDLLLATGFVRNRTEWKAKPRSGLREAASFHNRFGDYFNMAKPSMPRALL
jgi:hypothetical protein